MGRVYYTGFTVILFQMIHLKKLLKALESLVSIIEHLNSDIFVTYKPVSENRTFEIYLGIIFRLKIFCKNQNFL